MQKLRDENTKEDLDIYIQIMSILSLIASVLVSFYFHLQCVQCSVIYFVFCFVFYFVCLMIRECSRI